VDSLARRSGIKLDTARIDYEIARRGINQQTLAACAGLPPMTVSRARRGHPISEGTLRRIAEALAKIPLQLGADSLIAEPENKVAAGGPSPAATQGAGNALPYSEV
jgi:transcriptional regulator with XRE-family HTH domain